MAKILNFRTAEFRAGEAMTRREGISAEVILFPGIRYERWDARVGVASASSTKDANHASRDVLELAE